MLHNRHVAGTRVQFRVAQQGGVKDLDELDCASHDISFVAITSKSFTNEIADILYFMLLFSSKLL